MPRYFSGVQQERSFTRHLYHTPSCIIPKHKARENRRKARVLSPTWPSAELGSEDSSPELNMMPAIATSTAQNNSTLSTLF
jgi:hypothetical protein